MDMQLRKARNLYMLDLLIFENLSNHSLNTSNKTLGAIFVHQQLTIDYRL
jgi:hypothetical protein